MGVHRLDEAKVLNHGEHRVHEEKQNKGGRYKVSLNSPWHACRDREDSDVSEFLCVLG